AGRALDLGGDGASIVRQNQRRGLRGGESGARRTLFRLALRGKHEDIFVDYVQRFLASHAPLPEHFARSGFCAVIVRPIASPPEGVFPAASYALDLGKPLLKSVVERGSVKRPKSS